MLQIQDQYENSGIEAKAFQSSAEAPVMETVDQHSYTILLLGKPERRVQIAGWAHCRSS